MKVRGWGTQSPPPCITTKHVSLLSMHATCGRIPFLVPWKLDNYPTCVSCLLPHRPHVVHWWFHWKLACAIVWTPLSQPTCWHRWQLTPRLLILFTTNLKAILLGNALSITQQGWLLLRIIVKPCWILPIHSMNKCLYVECIYVRTYKYVDSRHPS